MFINYRVILNPLVNINILIFKILVYESIKFMEIARF